MIDLNKLKIFYHSAKSESYTNNDLNLSPSVVSRHVSDLEYRLKTKLFHRNTRRLSLTQEGQILYKAAQNIMNEAARAQAELLDMKDEPQGLLTVSTPTSWSSTILVRFISKFMKKYPKIRLNIVSDDRSLYAFQAHNDVALVPYAPDHEHLHKERVMDIHLGLFASQSYIDAMGMPQSLKDLDNHRLIAYADRDPHMSSINWHLTAGCQPGHTREPSLKAQNLSDAAEQGLGIVCMARENNIYSGGKLVPILPEEKAPVHTVYYVYPKHLKDSKCIHVFGAFLKELAQEVFPQATEKAS